jgi:hypothetical protein
MAHRAVVLTIIAGIALAAMLLASTLAGNDADWQGALRWAAEREAAWCAETRDRAAPPGDSGVASAHDGYAAALRAVHLGDEAEERLRRIVARRLAVPGPEASDPETLSPDDAAALAAMDEPVRLLRDAVRRSDRRLPLPRAGAPELDVLAIRPLVDAVLAAALGHRLDGADAAFVAHGIDALAFGCDLVGSRKSVEVMCGVLTLEACCGLFADERLRALSADALARLADATARVDDALARSVEPAHLEALALVAFLRGDGAIAPSELGLRSRLRAWRHGISLREFGRACTAEFVALVRELDRDAARLAPGWTARRVRLEQLERDGRRVFAGWFLGPCTGLVANERERCAALAQLRVLRLAVAFHLGLPLPSPADPLGDGPLAVEMAGDTARFGSADGTVARTAARSPR